MQKKNIRGDYKSIKNKIVRNEQYLLTKREEAKSKKRKSDVVLQEPDAPKKIPKTLDSKREINEEIVNINDEEIAANEAIDEFSSYFDGTVKPKVLITSSLSPSSRIFSIVGELRMIIPNSVYYSRKRATVEAIVEEAKDAGFTDVIILHEDKKVLNSLILVHLPNGPTAVFRVSHYIPNKNILNSGKLYPTEAELILNNFTTILGRRIGRMLSVLFPLSPAFKSRSCVTFHQNRDFIFFRYHRYIFKDGKVTLQEIGPRFTLRLLSLQEGTLGGVYNGDDKLKTF